MNDFTPQEAARWLADARKKRGLGPYQKEPSLYRRPTLDPDLACKRPEPKHKRRTCAGCGGKVYTTKRNNEDAFCRKCRSKPRSCGRCGGSMDGMSAASKYCMTCRQIVLLEKAKGRGGRIREKTGRSEI